MGTSTREQAPAQATKTERRVPRRDERGRFAESAASRRAAAERDESTRGRDQHVNRPSQSH